MDKAADMGLLTFALNVTLDGCCDHREMIADDELLDHFTPLIGAAQGVLVGSPMLSAALERLGLVDEYHLVVHPVLADHGPYLFQGLDCPRHIDLVSTTRLKSGVTAMHYRRKEG